jgi:hypothetical protein
MSRHVDPILKNFDFDHLPPPQRDVARLFHQMAVNLTMMLPTGPYKLATLRRLLEAKDFAVKSVELAEAA